MRKMDTQFDSAHSTCWVFLEDVAVPADNMIGYAHLVLDAHPGHDPSLVSPTVVILKTFTFALARLDALQPKAQAALQCRGVYCLDTRLITQSLFDSPENLGFIQLATNMNHERLVLTHAYIPG